MYISEIEENMIVTMIISFLAIQSLILFYVSGLSDRLKRNEKGLNSLVRKFKW